jgi:hypothetical protein
MPLVVFLLRLGVASQAKAKSHAMRPQTSLSRCDGEKSCTKDVGMVQSIAQPQNRSTKSQFDHARRDIYILVSGGLGGVLLPLLDNHGFEVLALGHLRLDLCNKLRQVWCVLCLSVSASLVGDGIPTSSGLVHSSLGRSWWDMESCHG